MTSLVNIFWPLQATAGALGVGGGRNFGWGDGSMPFLMVGLPVIVFVIWFELNRRNRDR